MIYIHKLDQLSPKTANIEVVPIIREIKPKTKLPLSKEEIRNSFIPYFVKDEDSSVMEHSLEIIPTAVQELKKLLDEKNAIYEEINIARAMKLIQEIPGPLKQNLAYAKTMFQNKNAFFDEAFNVISSIPNCKNYDQKAELNKKINELFKYLLRSEEFRFNCQDLITEAHTNHINDLANMLSNGYLFHVRIEEELNKASFETIRLRIPRDRLLISERIKSQVLEIKKGVDKAYKINMLTINVALLLYSYIRILKD